MSVKANVRSLGDIVELVRNGLTVSNRTGTGGIPITRIETISDHEVNPARVGYAGIAPGDRDEWLLQPGDILFSHINSVTHLGKCALYEGSPPQLIHGMNLLLIRPNRDLIEPRYLLRAFRSAAFRAQLAKHIKPAVNQASVSISALRTLNLTVPPLPEQRRIADILDKADTVRRKRKQAIALTEELLRSAFLEMFGDPVTNPKGWPCEPLERVVDDNTIVTYGIVQAGPQVDNGVPYIRTGDIQNGRILSEQLPRTSYQIAARYKRSEVRAGDIVMSIRATVGTVALVPAELDGANLTQGTARISPGSRVETSFLLAHLRAPGIQRWLAQHVKGVTFKEITLGTLRTAPIMLPPLDLQRHFSDLTAQLKTLSEQQFLSALWSDELFASLVQRAFRGELSQDNAAKRQLDLF